MSNYRSILKVWYIYHYIVNGGSNYVSSLKLSDTLFVCQVLKVFYQIPFPTCCRRVLGSCDWICVLLAVVAFTQFAALVCLCALSIRLGLRSGNLQQTLLCCCQEPRTFFSTDCFCRNLGTVL